MLEGELEDTRTRSNTPTLDKYLLIWLSSKQGYVTFWIQVFRVVDPMICRRLCFCNATLYVNSSYSEAFLITDFIYNFSHRINNSTMPIAASFSSTRA